MVDEVPPAQVRPRDHPHLRRREDDHRALGAHPDPAVARRGARRAAALDRRVADLAEGAPGRARGRPARCSGGCRRRTDRRARALASLDGVADVEQDLEVQLLAAIGEIERRHLRVVAGGLRALERFAVHVVEVGEDAFAGAGHAVLLEGV